MNSLTRPEYIASLRQQVDDAKKGQKAISELYQIAAVGKSDEIRLQAHRYAVEAANYLSALSMTLNALLNEAIKRQEKK